MSDRQQSEEPEEQLDLEGDDDVMDDDDGYRRRRDDSEEPEEDDHEERQAEGDGDGDVDGEDDAGMGAEGEEPAAGGGGGDDVDKGATDGPEDEEEKKKWEELLALPPHGSEVFIGGLPRDITEEDLREMCEPLGEIYEVRLTKDKDTKENKGFAFVTFTDKDAAQRAIEDVQDREYKGRTLRCSLSQAKHRLFVGNVPKGLSEEELRNIIQGKGPGVVNIEMFKDQHDPSRNRGFLFVEYYNHACADYARQKLSSPNFKVDGSQLTVSWAEPKGSTDPSSAAAQVKTIYVKNLPENASKEKVKELFEKHGEVTKIVLPPAKAGHKRDFGFVHFAERSSALKAVKGSEKYEIDGQVLEVSMAKPLADKKPDHSHRPGGGPNYPLPPYGGGYMGDPYGAYGGGPAYNQPMIYGRGPAPAGMRMVPMVLPDGRLGYVLQQPGGMPPPPPPRRGDRRDGARGGEGSHSRRYRPY
ncbi:heterogeneous nuclear ribonucleoprotein Q [Phragmites australis]|uniref:heterogeneous nuclear ribonucleoprotein Q n=1 Tax=Phragmites australis TaxID=29695 RepID=UPI002D77924F|nr:heterogeneous nuclear ribonucleoprotein Q [Phragmites australis]XP_062191780.1 heterogeneous nuclear ribonucleoprotein Q [Phragmites australis]